MTNRPFKYEIIYLMYIISNKLNTKNLLKIIFYEKKFLSVPIFKLRNTYVTFIYGFHLHCNRSLLSICYTRTHTISNEIIY